MAADPILYCLERVSDYREFERFCSSFLAGVGYPEIDPLGGTGDGGRDAIVRRDSAGRIIVFAYTVRFDWKRKLATDCARIHEKGHAPNFFVFVCTDALSASDKDFAYHFVRSTYSWALDLFDLERLRVQLAGPLQHLIAQHPSIFTPPFFPQRGGQSISPSRDLLLIDHHLRDHAIATWLARRLSLSGFQTWCRGTAPLAGENADETVRVLIEQRAIQYLPILSTSSLSDPLFVERCVLASARQDFVIPCLGLISPDFSLPSRIAHLTPAPFAASWRSGLSELLGRLQSLGVLTTFSPEQGRQIALRDFVPVQTTTPTAEPVYANLFSLTLPTSMFVFELRRQLLGGELLELRMRWAFVDLGNLRVASFIPPPEGLETLKPFEQVAHFGWNEFPEREGKKTFDIARELVRRSLNVACAGKGLTYCAHNDLFYFPASASDEWTQAIRHVDGRATTVQLTGLRTKGWGERASQFRYQLAPIFHASCDDRKIWSVVVRVYIRVTTLGGVPFEGMEVNRRRKIVTKSWWNQALLSRLLGVVQALESAPGEISVGVGNRSVVMETTPLHWECPVGLDFAALEKTADLGAEMAELRAVEGETAPSESTPIGPRA